MKTTKKILLTQEDTAKIEIRAFVEEGLIDVQRNDLYDFDEVFDELESRYKGANV